MSDDLKKMYIGVMQNYMADVVYNRFARHFGYLEGSKYVGEFTLQEGDRTVDDGMFLQGATEAVQKLRQINKQTRIDLMNFLEDLWYYIVQSTAVKGPPAERRTLYVKKTVGGTSEITVGWYNYPSGYAKARMRFTPRAEMWKHSAAQMIRTIFNSSMDISKSSAMVSRLHSASMSEFTRYDKGSYSPPAKAEKGGVIKGKGGKFKREWRRK